MAAYYEMRNKVRASLYLINLTKFMPNKCLTAGGVLMQTLSLIVNGNVTKRNVVFIQIRSLL